MRLTYRLAEYDEKISTNPLRKVRQKKENNARERYLNQYEPAETQIEWLKEYKTEADRLRAVIVHDYPEHLVEYVIALETGMRRSEQYGRPGNASTSSPANCMCQSQSTAKPAS